MSADFWIIDPDDDDANTIPPMKPSDDPCMQEMDGYLCSRASGHRGSHAASGLYGTYAVWRWR